MYPFFEKSQTFPFGTFILVEATMQSSFSTRYGRCGHQPIMGYVNLAFKECRVAVPEQRQKGRNRDACASRSSDLTRYTTNCGWLRASLQLAGIIDQMSGSQLDFLDPQHVESLPADGLAAGDDRTLNSSSTTFTMFADVAEDRSACR